MERRKIVQLTELRAGSLFLPMKFMGNYISSEALLEPGMDISIKKQLADIALNTAKSLGATYADARIGRYLNQYVFTREIRFRM